MFATCCLVNRRSNWWRTHQFIGCRQTKSVMAFDWRAHDSILRQPSSINLAKSNAELLGGTIGNDLYAICGTSPCDDDDAGILHRSFEHGDGVEKRWKRQTYGIWWRRFSLLLWSQVLNSVTGVAMANEWMIKIWLFHYDDNGGGPFDAITTNEWQTVSYDSWLSQYWRWPDRRTMVSTWHTDFSLALFALLSNMWGARRISMC